MDENADTNELKSLIAVDLHLEKDEAMLNISNIETIKKKLIEVINMLLQNDYHRLVNAMYRLDINEKLFRETISGLHSPGVAARLADLVIDREIEKVKTPKRYH